MATLIMAMLVGVLVGHYSTSSPSTPARAGNINVTVGGGGGASPATTASSPSSTGSSTSSGSSSKSANNPPIKGPAKVNTKTIATPPATVSHGAQVSGGNHTNLPSSTAQQGGGCSAGTAGCQNGQNTGNFFGGP